MQDGYMAVYKDSKVDYRATNRSGELSSPDFWAFRAFIKKF